MRREQRAREFGSSRNIGTSLRLAPLLKMTTADVACRDHQVVTPAQTVGIGACVAISIVVLSVSANGSRSKQAARRALKAFRKADPAPSPNVAERRNERRVALSKRSKRRPRRRVAECERRDAETSVSDDGEIGVTDVLGRSRHIVHCVHARVAALVDFSAEPPNVSDVRGKLTSVTMM